MDSILASIRRIIMEDEAGVSAAKDNGAHEDQDDELLVLQPSMMVDRADKGAESMDQHAPGAPSGLGAPGAPAAPAAPSLTAAELAAALFDQDPEPHAAPAPALAPALAPVPAPAPSALAAAAPARLVQPPRPDLAPGAAEDTPLLAPDASLAAAQSLASLQDAVRPHSTPADAQAAGLAVFRSGGPSLEDMVRDELRGQLKLWLDANLPAMVERLVRQEIERLARPA